jgi:hypothetical protein
MVIFFQYGLEFEFFFVSSKYFGVYFKKWNAVANMVLSTSINKQGLQQTSI